MSRDREPTTRAAGPTGADEAGAGPAAPGAPPSGGPSAGDARTDGAFANGPRAQGSSANGTSAGGSAGPGRTRGGHGGGRAGDGERRGRVLRTAMALLSGPLAGFAALAVAELVAVPVRPESSPVDAVGGAVIDQVPTPLKEFAVRTFGEQDKLVLQLGIVAVLTLFALALGLLGRRFRRSAAAGVLLFGVVGAGCALGRPEATALDTVPSAVGALAGALALYLMAGRLGTRPAGPPAAAVPGPRRAAYGGRRDGAARKPGHEGPGGHGSREDHPEHEYADATGSTSPGSSASPSPAASGTPGVPGTPSASGVSLASPFDRRGFAVTAGAVLAGATGAGLLGLKLNASSGASAAASRDKIVLPAPASRAAPVPRGAELDVPGLDPFLTPAEDFYRVDTALSVPRLDASAWRLRLHGRGVGEPVTLDFQDLLRRRLIERDITLTCVSNQVGGSYVGNARWLGVPLADVLREAGVRPPSKGGPADQLVARSADGMTLGSPVETVMDGRDAMLAVGMNGRPLPFAHGFPVRMVVPGLFGFVSACKWLTELELTTFDDYDVYWVRRDWAREAPVKTQSRIDTPKPLSSHGPGTVKVAGVAWAQHRGVDRVEVSVDGGPWHRAGLADEDSRDTWRQWVWDWPATTGSHTLQVRATDGRGETQTAERVGTVPDGASGRHSVVVTVT